MLEEIVVPLCEDFRGSFKVETNRADKKFELNSMQISREIGGRILASNHALKVDIKEPEFKYTSGIFPIIKVSHKRTSDALSTLSF